MKRTAVSAGVVVALVAVAVAVVAVGGVGATAQADETTETNDSDSFGAEISSFMQASSAEAEGEVEDGMFSAAIQRADGPEERRSIIEQRQERLQQRQARLQERRSEMDTGDGADVRDRALATHVTIGAANLERSVNGTERAAQAAGVDTATLDEIRRNARDLRGPEVAELAGSLGNGLQSSDRGKPIDVPTPGNVGPDEPGANRSNSRAQPDNVGGSDDPRNDTGSESDGESGETGPPGDDEEPGNPDGREQEQSGSDD